MDGIYFESSQGRLHVVGRIHADPNAPAMVIVGGAFPPKELKHDLINLFPRASIVVCRYPGMHSEAWTKPGPRHVATALDELLKAWLPGRRVAAFGISTGCLVTLNLQAPEVRRQIAMEPFLGTAHTTPFIAYCRDYLAKAPDNKPLITFLDDIFGITQTTVTDRDYRDFRSDPSLPLDLIVGSSEDTGGAMWPSFTREVDREILLNRPEARLFVGPPGSGHHVETTPEAEAMVRDCVAQALDALAADVKP